MIPDQLPKKLSERIGLWKGLPGEPIPYLSIEVLGNWVLAAKKLEDKLERLELEVFKVKDF